jgi:hypothetical protein
VPIHANYPQNRVYWFFVQCSLHIWSETQELHTLNHHCQQRQLEHDGITSRALEVKQGKSNRARIVRGHTID